MRLKRDFDRSIDRLPVKMTGNFFIGDFDPRDRGESEYTGEVGLRAILGLAEALRGITRSLFRIAKLTGIYPVRISRERDKNSVKSLRAKMTAVKSYIVEVHFPSPSDSPPTRYRLIGDFDR